MDESFAVNLARGTASLTVPLGLTAGREGATPPLVLSYDSGAGNSPFGIGFSVTVNRVSRRVRTGVPQYSDADGYELTGVDDLVPALRQEPDGGWVPDLGTEMIDGAPHLVEQFVPRTDTAPGDLVHLRIERCTAATGEVFWRSVSRDNVVSEYGRTAASRVADPADAGRVFEWLLCRVHDDRGNVVSYDYKQEDTAGVSLSAPEERHRLTGPAPAGRYLKRVGYANTVPGDAATATLSVVFDYGEHDLGVDEVRTWPVRADPFSRYTSGFEVRTWRLCRRILVLHSFPDELGPGPSPRLVRSTDLAYTQDPVLTVLSAITRTGYQWNGNGYSTESLPPLELRYTQAAPDSEVRLVSAAPVPESTAGEPYWIDLDGEGIPGALSRAGDGWWFQRNLGGGRLDRPNPVDSRPVVGSTRLRLAGLAGDGRTALIDYGPELFGSTARDEGGWTRFRPFVSRPVLDLDDPGVRQVDLDGDGLADLLRGGGNELVWHRCLGYDGYGPARTVTLAGDEMLAPQLGEYDQLGLMWLADMSGDGLADIVRVRNGEVCYWPSLGHGRFGAKVVMGGAPVFDTEDLFEPRRLRLADLDGTGPHDLLYLGGDGVRYWRNLSGNGFGTPTLLAQLPQVDGLAQATVTDLFGTATACLVWSTPLAPGEVRYLDLCAGTVRGSPRAGVKPWLLSSLRANKGAETTMEYASSTEFYLADRAAGRPWSTRLPFPVQVVSRIHTTEAVSGTQSTARYAYRHGYFDGVERQFRGFGLVEEWDTEDHDPGPDELPTARTRSWFHTGSYEQALSDTYQGDPQAVVIGPSEIDSPGAGGPVDGEEYRLALRALAGRELRTEVYADDGAAVQGDPYLVTMRRHRVTRRQPGVFRVHERESVTYHYERDRADPRISHELTMEVDSYGSVRSRVSIGYRRRIPAVPEQQATHVTWKLTDVAHQSGPGVHRLGTPVQERAFEVTGLPEPVAGLYTVQELAGPLAAALDVAFEAGSTTPPPGTVHRRCTAHRRIRYWSDDLGTALPLGQPGIRALTWQSYRLALTAGVLSSAFAGTPLDPAAAVVAAEGGYLSEDGGWWAPSGIQRHDPTWFYLPVSMTSPFGNTSTVSYDPYHLRAVRAVASATTPYDRLVTTVEHDYRTLLPRLVTDPNGSRRWVAFSPVGLVTASWSAGPPDSGIGDPDALPGIEFTYDLQAWRLGTGPVWAQANARERHGDPASPWQRTRVYTDGLGREAMRKTQAEPGLAWDVDMSGQPVLVDTGTAVRWAATGRTVYNNKGLPVREYEPYFSASPSYEDADLLVKQGVTPVLFYDPLGRHVRTELADGTETRTQLHPWLRLDWDGGDTVLDSPWYAERQGAGVPATQQRAATASATYAATPSTTIMDALGRAVRIRTDNGGGVEFETVLTLDITGETIAVTDARGVACTSQIVDLLGRTLRIVSADAGVRLTLPDAAGAPLRTADACGTPPAHADAAGNVVRYGYDPLRRPVEIWVTAPGRQPRLADLAVYGEHHPQGAAHNLLGDIYRHYDDAGADTVRERDFNREPLVRDRQVLSLTAAVAGTPVDWAALAGQPLSALDSLTAATLDGEVFTTSAQYDALGRVTLATLPDGTRVQPSYSEAGLLETLQAKLGTATTATTFVSGLDHDARGRRLRVNYGNGVVTDHSYDPQSLRLRAIRTIGPGGSGPIQDLGYTYDSAGNVVEVVDGAQPTQFFAGAVATPGARYAYDPVYRLVSATGREHASLNQQPDRAEPQRRQVPHPNEADALRPYTETYSYDPAGNLVGVRHNAGPAGTWTCGYTYGAASNRLLWHTTASGGGPAQFRHDGNGRMIAMAHLPGLLAWDHADRLTSIDLLGGGTARYAYGATGQRVRKVLVRDGGLVEERLYLGQYEVFRRYRNAVLVFERRTVHVTDGADRVALVETVTVDVDHPGFDATAAIRYQLEDRLGSCVVELDEAGAIISYEEYHPYGSTAVWLARAAATVSTKRYRYLGREKDDETGLSYHGARFYATWLGRWTSADPAGAVDGPNLFAYSRNNPIGLTDPSGHQSKPPGGGSATMPPNTATGGSLAHAIILPTLAARLNFLGIEAYPEHAVAGGSKNLNTDHAGHIDLVVKIGDKAHLYELKPDNPESYQDYVSEVDHYRDYLRALPTGPVTPIIGTVLGVVERAIPPVFTPIEIPLPDNKTLILTFKVAKDNNGVPIDGLLVYNATIRPNEERKQQSGQATVAQPQFVRATDPARAMQNKMSLMQPNLRANAEAQVHGEVRTQIMVGTFMVEMQALASLGVVVGGLEAVGLGTVGTGAATTGPGALGTGGQVIPFVARAGASQLPKAAAVVIGVGTVAASQDKERKK